MSVQQTDRIDFMSHDAKTNIFWLNMTEERAWAAINPEFPELKAKVNTYIRTVQTGDLIKHTPESRNKSIGFRLFCETEPTDDALHILSLIKAAYEHFKIHFSVLLLEGDNNREIPIKTGEISGVRQQEPPMPKKPWWKVW